MDDNVELIEARGGGGGRGSGLKIFSRSEKGDTYSKETT